MLNRRVLGVSAGLGMGAIATMAVLFLGVSQAFPFFVGNVGDFMVSAETIEVEDFGLTMAVDENSGSNGSQMPAGDLSLGRAELSNLLLEKTFDVQSVIGDIPQPEWVFSLSSNNPIVLEGATVYSAGLCADLLDATGVVIDGKGENTATFLDDFELSIDNVTLTRPAIQATYLATAGLQLTDVQISISPGGYQVPPCAG